MEAICENGIDCGIRASSGFTRSLMTCGNIWQIRGGTISRTCSDSCCCKIIAKGIEKKVTLIYSLTKTTDHNRTKQHNKSSSRCVNDESSNICFSYSRISVRQNVPHLAVIVKIKLSAKPKWLNRSQSSLVEL